MTRAYLDHASTSPLRPEARAAMVEWLDGATEVSGSWWEDWSRWAAERGGERRDPPPLGSDAHPPLEDAPGSYVRES